MTMISALYQLDENRLAKATSETIVAKDWQGNDVHELDDIYTLNSTGDIVLADTDEMAAYLKYRISKLGIRKWARDDIGDGTPIDFIVSLVTDPVPIEVIFESYYDAKRSLAGEKA